MRSARASRMTCYAFIGRSGGNLSVKVVPAAGPARGSHHSAMALDDRFHDRQPKPAAGRVPRTGRIRLIEPVEYVRQMLRRDARTGIADRHDDCHRPRYAAFSATRPPFGVWRSAFAARFCSACSSRIGSPVTISAPGAMLVVDLNAFLLGRAAVAREHAPEQILERHVLRIERLAAAFEARQIQQIADDVLDALRLVANDRRDSARAFRGRAIARGARAFRDSRACRSAASSARATRRRAAAAACDRRPAAAPRAAGDRASSD